MGNLWFWLVGAMLVAYVVLDGFDLGAGAIHLMVARTEAERRLVLRTIGPVWDGNEVWLIAGGGTLYFAFPRLYASSFSGFYLPLMMVLWFLILRGAAVEFRSHVASRVWASFWDAVFCVSSALLAVFYGAALGNVVRGVPLDSGGRFFEPLWTNFLPGVQNGILDWYSILTGVASLAALTLHGALWVARKTEGAVNQRARRLAEQVWWAVLLLTSLITWSSFALQPQLGRGLAEHPWALAFPVLALGGLFGIPWFLRRGDENRAFYASCAYLAGMMTSVAGSLFPLVMPASTNPEFSLTVANSKAADYGLRIGLAWWVIGISLAIGYQIFSYRRFGQRIRLEEDSEGY